MIYLIVETLLIFNSFLTITSGRAHWKLNPINGIIKNFMKNALESGPSHPLESLAPSPFGEWL
jgi:hypothetical protein